MDGSALSWFQLMHCNGQLSLWNELPHSLEIRFAPSQYEDPEAPYSNYLKRHLLLPIKQNLKASLIQFTIIHSIYVKLFYFWFNNQPFDVNFKPYNLKVCPQAIDLAKLQEEKIFDRHFSKSWLPKRSSLPSIKDKPPLLSYCLQSDLLFPLIHCLSNDYVDTKNVLENKFVSKYCENA